MLLSQIEIVKNYARYLIAPALGIMLYGLFLSVPVKDFAKAFYNKRFVYWSLGINFLWTPMLAWVLGYFLLYDHPYLWIGFIMLMVTPCTDWYLIFTKIAGGNIALSTAILPVNLILQLVLLPMYLLLFSGVSGDIAPSGLLESILFVLAIPFLLAQLSRSKILNRKSGISLKEKLESFFNNAQLGFLCLAITAMFAAKGGYIMNNPEIIFMMVIPVILFFAINFVVSQVMGNLLIMPYEDKVSLSLTTLARNSPVSLAIAVTAFPGQPLVALPLVIGPLIELPVLGLISQALMYLNKS